MARVLLVDDNADVLESLSLLVETLGHEVALARNSTEALQVASTFNADVALLDMVMPSSAPSDQTASELRKRGVRRVIALTALQATQANVTRAAFDGWLIKPVNTDELMRLLAA